VSWLDHSNKWDLHFLSLSLSLSLLPAVCCLLSAKLSKDPNTQVGALIVGPDNEVRSTGYNGFPRGIADTDERLQDRDLKLKLIVHGEMNAILAAARVGIALKGCVCVWLQQS